MKILFYLLAIFVIPYFIERILKPVYWLIFIIFEMRIGIFIYSLICGFISYFSVFLLFRRYDISLSLWVYISMLCFKIFTGLATKSYLDSEAKAKDISVNIWGTVVGLSLANMLY